MNTNQLIKQCKQNNYKAQIEVYNAYKNMMLGEALRILKNREEAEDIVQYCFIKAFEKIHQLKEDANLGGWLKRIVINKSLDIARSKYNLNKIYAGVAHKNTGSIKALKKNDFQLEGIRQQHLFYNSEWCDQHDFGLIL